MGATARRAEIRRLTEVLNAGAAQLETLKERNAALRLRMAGLRLMVRVLTEVADHRRAHGAAPGPLQAQLELLRDAAAGGVAAMHGGGAGGGAATAIGRASSEPSVAGSTCCTSPHGSRGGGGGHHAACAVNGGEAPSPDDGDADIVAAVPHVAPGRSLVHLGTATPADVARVAAQDLATYKATMRAHYDAAVRLAGEAARAARAGDVARAARTRASYAQQSELRVREYQLTMCWAFDIYARSSTTHHETVAPSVGLTDAPLPHWQRVAAAARLTRLQALLIVDMCEGWRARMRALHDDRAALSAQLINARGDGGGGNYGGGDGGGGGDGNGGGGSGGGGGGGTSGSGGDAAAATSALEAELLEAFEANVAAERGTIQVFAHALVAMLSPVQYMDAFCAAWPYPINGVMVCEVVSQRLRLEGPNAYPEAPPPAAWD